MAGFDYQLFPWAYLLSLLAVYVALAWVGLHKLEVERVDNSSVSCLIIFIFGEGHGFKNVERVPYAPPQCVCTGNNLIVFLAFFAKKRNKNHK